MRVLPEVNWGRVEFRLRGDIYLPKGYRYWPNLHNTEQYGRRVVSRAQVMGFGDGDQHQQTRSYASEDACACA